jgi:transcriptional regulator with XRE-family HTH domain
MPDRAKPGRFIDRSVGARVRIRRELIGLTPEAFAARLGCDADLILRYESGHTRVGALVLMRLTQVCRSPISYFLAEIGDEPDSPPPLD